MPRVVSFKREPNTFGGHSNEAFNFDGLAETNGANGALDLGEISLRQKGRKITPENKFHMLLLTKKQPLEKSLSMPDMHNRVKKRERLLA